jgi:hypothetical protein
MLLHVLRAALESQPPELMPNWLSIFKSVVWTAIMALLFGFAAFVMGVTGADLEAVAGTGILGLIMAILARDN